MNDTKYIGLDVHQATISATVLDSSGKLVMEAILEAKALLPTIRCAAALAPASAARVIGREQEAQRNAVVAPHPIDRADSGSSIACAHPDATPLPHQATTAELQRLGPRDPQQWGIPHGAWPAQTLQENRSHPRTQ